MPLAIAMSFCAVTHEFLRWKFPIGESIMSFCASRYELSRKKNPFSRLFVDAAEVVNRIAT
jgi:hypothetical protein